MDSSKSSLKREEVDATVVEAGHEVVYKMYKRRWFGVVAIVRPRNGSFTAVRMVHVLTCVSGPA